MSIYIQVAFTGLDISILLQMKGYPLETVNSVVLKVTKNEKEFVLIIDNKATYGESFDACIEMLNIVLDMAKKAVSESKERQGEGVSDE